MPNWHRRIAYQGFYNGGAHRAFIRNFLKGPSQEGWGTEVLQWGTGANLRYRGRPIPQLQELKQMLNWYNF